MNFKLTKLKLLTLIITGLVILLVSFIIKCNGLCFVEPNIENFYIKLIYGLIALILIYIIWSLIQKKK